MLVPVTAVPERRVLAIKEAIGQVENRRVAAVAGVVRVPVVGHVAAPCRLPCYGLLTCYPATFTLSGSGVAG